MLHDEKCSGTLAFMQEEWRTYFPTGIFWGITTNPTVLERDGVECSIPSLALLAQEAFDCGAQEVLIQAWGSTAKEMHSVGRALADIDPRVNIKVPITKAGTEAAALLQKEKVDVTLTAVYTVHQAITAAASGAAYAAPYLGRMNDARRDGFNNIVNMHRIVQANSGDTRIMVASLRSADDMAALAAEGLNTFTFSPTVAAEMFHDELTIAASEDFERAARRNRNVMTE